MTATLSLAQQQRADWVNAVYALARGGQPAEAVERIRAEARTLGSSRGWVGACEWFEQADREHPADLEWLAIQSLIWFGREV